MQKIRIGTLLFASCTLIGGGATAFVSSCAENGPKDFPNFTLSTDHPLERLDFDYSEDTFIISSSIDNPNVNIAYTIGDNNTNGCITLSEGSHNTSNLILSEGLGLSSNYYFIIQATASEQGFNDKTIDFTFHFSVTLRQFNDFNITNDLTTNETYGYAQKQVTLSTTCDPSDATIAYTFGDDSTSYLGGKLTISGNQLTLHNNLTANTYEYVIKATASKDGYAPKTVTSSTYSLVIGKKDIPIQSATPTIPLFSAIAYGYTSNQISTNNFDVTGLPDDYTGNATYHLINNPGNLLFINSSNHLVLTPGAGVGNVDYTYKIVLPEDDNYKAAEITNSCSGTIPIGKANLPLDNIVVTPPTFSTIDYNYSSVQTSTDAFDIQGLPDDYGEDAVFILTNDPTGGKLSIIADNHLQLALNANAGQNIQYSYKVELPTSANYHSNEITGLTGVFSINKINLPIGNISGGAAPTFSTITYGYTSSQTSTNALSITGLPFDYNGTKTYQMMNNPNNRFSIDSSNKLVLAPGANAETIDYTYKIILSGDNNYNDAEITTGCSGSVTIERANFNNFEVRVNSGTVINPVEVGYNTQTYALSNTYSSPPGNTTFTYVVITGPAQASINNSSLVIAQGLNRGQYALSIRCTASNPNYVSKESSILTLTFYVSGVNETMTSNTAPTPYSCQASSQYQESGSWGPAWRAFDNQSKATTANQVSRGWCSLSNGIQWIRYYFGPTTRKLTKYVLYGGNATAGNLDHFRGPSKWTIQGSTNGSSWTDVVAQTSVNITALAQTFNIPIVNQSTLYNYYRMYIPADGVRDGYVEIAELIFYTA